MRKLILALLILLLSVAAALVLYRWGGLVIITLGEWTLQTSVLFFVLALVAALALLQLAVALLRGLFGVPGRLGQWRQQRRERQVRNRLIKGLLRLAEGRSEEAEKLLTWNVHLSEAPLLHYLGAAIAAQRQGAHEQRDAYLAQADKSSPKASLAVGLIQAQLQLEARQWEQALATLHYLHDLAPNHPRVQAMLLRACEALGEWKRIELLLPAARRQKAVSSGELSRLEWTAALRRLQQAQAQGAAAVEAAWNSLDRRLRQDTDLEIVYVDGLAANGQGEQAERLLRTRLNKSYDPRLAQRYGQLPLAAPEKALSQVEKWLLERPDDPVLLQAAGRLALQARLWGRARDYLEAASARQSAPDALYLLGRLLEQMGELEPARERYRQALERLSGNGGALLPLNSAEQRALIQAKDEQSRQARP
ncbi:MAG: heme biosynthesis protein HemY [Xanthomonadaceae bacterium]|nr:heme biosynthesis protein HemY [Xanthomonadaceae bacterium]